MSEKNYATDEMMESGVEAFMDAHKHHATPYGIVTAIWEAMLAKSDLRPSDADDAEFGMSKHRNGCAIAVLSHSPTTGGITCTKCNSHAFHGEELKCRWTAVGFVMTQVEGLVISLESDVERLAQKLTAAEASAQSAVALVDAQFACVVHRGDSIAVMSTDKKTVIKVFDAWSKQKADEFCNGYNAAMEVR